MVVGNDVARFLARKKQVSELLYKAVKYVFSGKSSSMCEFHFLQVFSRLRCSMPPFIFGDELILGEWRSVAAMGAVQWSVRQQMRMLEDRTCSHSVCVCICDGGDFHILVLECG